MKSWIIIDSRSPGKYFWRQIRGWHWRAARASTVRFHSDQLAIRATKNYISIVFFLIGDAALVLSPGHVPFLYNGTLGPSFAAVEHVLRSRFLRWPSLLFRSSTLAILFFKLETTCDQSFCSAYSTRIWNSPPLSLYGFSNLYWCHSWLVSALLRCYRFATHFNGILPDSLHFQLFILCPKAWK